jgi:ABC-type glycerol-3-phosphate transport system substrate-binding protein
MQTKTTFKFLGATLLSLMLAACGGGGGGSTLDNTLNGGNSSLSNSSSSAIGEDTLQSLEFTDATPGTINLKGTGGAESALVRFRTLGKTGKPIQNIRVNFSLTSDIGGLALTQDFGISDKDGYISTYINST